MQVKQAFRFELDPNRAARVALKKHVGAARFAVSLGLARGLEALEQGQPLPTAAQLHKEWNRWKRQHAPWWVEVSKCAPQEALRDLEPAGGLPPRRQDRAGLPRSLDDNKARLTGSIRVLPRPGPLPRLGKVRTKERTDKLLALLSEGKARILSATIARKADRWFVSLTCEVERPDPAPRAGEPVGVDLGLRSFLVLSDGTRVEAPSRLSGRGGGCVAAPASFPASRKGRKTTPGRPCTAGCGTSAGTAPGWRKPSQSSSSRT